MLNARPNRFQELEDAKLYPGQDKNKELKKS